MLWGILQRWFLEKNTWSSAGTAGTGGAGTGGAGAVGAPARRAHEG